jgi:hypothetical protein
MKFNSKIVSFFVFCLLMSSVIWEGCQTQTPTSSAIAQPSVDQYAIVNITSLSATAGQHLIGNPTGLIGEVSYAVPVTVCAGSTPFQLVPSGLQHYNPMGGAVTVYTGPGCKALSTVGFNVAFIPTGLTDSYDQYGVNIMGYMNDPENPNYPPGPDNLDNVTFEALPGAGSAYDVSPYQGIQFYINVSNLDSAIDRQFLANVQEQLPPSGGGVCQQAYDPTLTHCYDGFLYDYENIPTNQWVLVQKNWGELKQWGFGSITSPPTFSGSNLQQLVSFQWAELNAGDSGPITISYTIAGIRFY